MVSGLLVTQKGLHKMATKSLRTEPTAAELTALYESHIANVGSVEIPKLFVTQCQVYPLKEAVGKTKGLARVVLNEGFQLCSLRIIDGVHGLFVSYPNDLSYKGEDYRSIFYPLTKAVWEHVEHVVLAKYRQATEQA